MGVIGLGAFLIPNWYMKLVDRRERSGVVVHFFEPPKDVFVLEMAYLFDKKFHFRDVLAWMVDLKFRGFLKFERDESGKVFAHKVKDLESDQALEMKLWDMYLGGLEERVDLKIVLNEYFDSLLLITFDFWKDLESKNYFVGNKGSDKFWACVIGMFVFIIAAVLLPKIHILLTFLVGCGLVSFSIWVTLKMPRRTSKGVRVFKELIGFRDYLVIAEKDREKFRQSLETQKLEIDKNGKVEFSSLLPYMIVLNVDKKWYETLIPELKDYVDGEDLVAGISSYHVKN